jgi:antitoxin MazE
MDLSVIQIGDSKGIRFSKSIVEKYKLKDTVELILKNDYIILKPKKIPRENWELAFQEMHENADDKLLIDDVFEDESFEEWN